MDVLADNLRAAQDRHAKTLRNGTQREICETYIAALEAERALFADCTGKADQEAAELIGYEIDDVRAELARLS